VSDNDSEALSKLLDLITSDQDKFRTELDDLKKLEVLQSEEIVVLSKKNKSLQKRVKELEQRNGNTGVGVTTALPMLN
jgi:hypothetical protein